MEFFINPIMLTILNQIFKRVVHFNVNVGYDIRKMQYLLHHIQRPTTK